MTRLSVPDMSCAHCKASVETALSTVPDVGTVTVDLNCGEVTVSGSAPAGQLIVALGKIGFPAQVIAQG